ncbi:aromatic ring-hydroxylating dioxygenase subunit alpha [Corynebacterium sp. USCH3]|uniref:aromatic ring-hydroxylating oxygenase subunit alpha n=1 Tax=Corynebacterium sp. USCH3 TaxID=3024840 RepID=UPI0030998DF4
MTTTAPATPATPTFQPDVSRITRNPNAGRPAPTPATPSTGHTPRPGDLPLPRKLTFDPDDWQIIARFWYPVAYSSEVTEGPLGVTLLDKPLVVYRVDGKVTVADNLCTHRGMMLSLGEDQHDGKGIKCPYHGLRFGQGGRCTEIPAHPSSRIPNRMHLPAYGAVERYGLVWANLAAKPGDVPGVDTDSGIPPVPHWDEDGYQRINCPGIDVAAFAGRQVEGFLDVAHFAFVHDKSFALADQPEVPDYTPQVTADGFETEYWSTMPNIPHDASDEVKAAVPDGFRWLRHFRLHVPFTATLDVHFPGGKHLAMMNTACPVSATQTRLFDARVRNFDTDQPVQDVYDFNLQVFEEDRAMVEAQKPENLPLDPSLEVHIPADKSSIAYRRALRGLGLSQFFTA